MHGRKSGVWLKHRLREAARHVDRGDRGTGHGDESNLPRMSLLGLDILGALVDGQTRVVVPYPYP